MRKVNPETITGTLSWHKILPPNGLNLIRAKHNLHIRRKKSFLKFLEPSHRPKVENRQLDGIWESMWSFIMESTHFNTSSIRDKWHRWRSRSTSKGRYVSSIATVRTGWKMVGWFNGMLFVSAKCSRPLGKRDNAVRKTIWRTIQRANDIFWSNGWIVSSVFTKRSVENSSNWQESITCNFSWLWADRGWNWKGDILKADLEDLEKLDASNICKDRGYSYVWASGQEPRLTHMGKASSARQTISYRTFQRIWHHPLRDWDLILQREPGQRNIKSESLNTSTQSPHFQSRSGKLNHTGRTYSHGGMMDCPRIHHYGMEYWENSWLCGISKLENQLHNWGLLTNSRSSGHRALDQRSWDCLNWRTCVTSQGSLIFLTSICLMRWLRQPWRRFSPMCTSGKELVSKSSELSIPDRFFRGRQIAHMLHEHFSATGACEAVQGLSTLFPISLQNDDVQDFDVRWDHVLLSVSEMPSDMILERLYKSKLENSVQHQTVMALYDQEVARNNLTPNYQQDSCKTSYWSDDENSKLQSLERCCGKESSHQESKKEGKLTLRGKWESVFSGRHMDNVPKETHVVSVMTSKPLKIVARVRNEKGDCLLPHPIRRQNRLTARDKNPHWDQAVNRKTHLTRVFSMPIQIL